ncbi:MAG: hypothetical protein FH753_11110 [Firmicutes bacterium]|nr:hypothetical protein [Bacillota bacterium]
MNIKPIDTIKAAILTKYMGECGSVNYFKEVIFQDQWIHELLEGHIAVGVSSDNEIHVVRCEDRDNPEAIRIIFTFMNDDLREEMETCLLCRECKDFADTNVMIEDVYFVNI